MTNADLWVVLGLLTASFGYLAATLALLATINWLLSRAWRAGATAAARHIETCMTQALQIPLYPNLEDEHRDLLQHHRD